MTDRAGIGYTEMESYGCAACVVRPDKQASVTVCRTRGAPPPRGRFPSIGRSDNGEKH
jgi:hypothetical protein